MATTSTMDQTPVSTTRYAAFYSDPHFGHANIIGYARRPFVSVDHMDDKLIDGYNAVVKPNDVVLWLGDAFLCKRDRAERILKQLHGFKRLVMGNHDLRTGASKLLDMGFEAILPEHTILIGGRICRVSHYPYIYQPEGVAPVIFSPKIYNRYPKRVLGEILLHGHTHSDKKVRGDMIHLGVDAWGYRPVRYAEVERLVLDRNPVCPF